MLLIIPSLIICVFFVFFIFTIVRYFICFYGLLPKVYMKKKYYDLNDEHYLKCQSCRRQATIKNLIMDDITSIAGLLDLRDFIDGLINGDTYD